MYYASAGQQSAQQGQRATSGGPTGSAGGTASGPGQGLGGGQTGPGSSNGPGGFPPLGGGAGGMARGVPPGFGSRASDSNDFPALPHASTYASQAQTQMAPPSTSSSNQHLPPQQQQQQQQMYMQGGGTGGGASGLAPPPPPGIGASPGSQPNGLSGDSLRGEDFPALGAPGDSKDRMGRYMGGSSQQPPSPSLVNGASTSQSTSATPSTNPPLPNPGEGQNWQRISPSRAQGNPNANEPIMRPVQQIMSSPVDKWGLKALLYEIKMGVGKDRGRLLFGEELSELGVDLEQSESLYPTFATPWIDQSTLPRQNISEPFVLPSCYNLVAPPVSTKVQNFSEETLFFAFYSAPQDTLQLEVAEELFARGWRYHMELQCWLTSPALQSTPLDPTKTQWMRGPFQLLDPRTLISQASNDDFVIDLSQLEVTRPAAQIIAEERAKKESARSPNGSIPAGRGGLQGHGGNR